MAAVTGLAGVAGFHAVYASLIKIQWPWLEQAILTLYG